MTRSSRLYLLDDLRGVEVYVAVVEANSITRAAIRLGLAPSTVSKKLAELEARSQIRLLHRTTRRISMTEVGQRFYDQCLRLLNEAERAEWELRDDAVDVGGRLRVTAPVVFTQRQIAPLLPSFLAQYPKVDFELFASARKLNLVEEGFDLSIQLGPPDQLSRCAQSLAVNRRVVCASQAYLDRHGTPREPSDLAGHTCLVAVSTHRADVWRFHGKSGLELIRVKGSLTSDNASTLAEAAAQGVGVAMLGTYVVGDYLRAGLLKEILPTRVEQHSIIIGVVPERSFLPRRVKLFLQHLVEGFGSPPTWDRDLPNSALRQS